MIRVVLDPVDEDDSPGVVVERKHDALKEDVFHRRVDVLRKLSAFLADEEEPGFRQQPQAEQYADEDEGRHEFSAFHREAESRNIPPSWKKRGARIPGVL